MLGGKYMKNVAATNRSTAMSTSYMIKVALLGAIAVVLMFIESPPIGFLRFDISDVPAMIGGFALGPVAGIIVLLIKNLFHVPMSTTMYVGELANFLIGIAMVVPASLIYRRSKTRKSAIVGMLVGTVAMAITGALANIYLLLPLYMTVYQMSPEAISGMMNMSFVTNINTLILFAIVPFNLIKGLLILVVTQLIYKRISPMLHR